MKKYIVNTELNVSPLAADGIEEISRRVASALQKEFCVSNVNVLHVQDITGNDAKIVIVTYAIHN